MSRIGVFGGTFNPVHNGHIRLVKTVAEAIGLDRVIVMPDRIPPHKAVGELISGKDRFEMCRLAFEDMPNVEVSDWELKRRGKSYTVYTARHFKKLYPDDELWLIMGSDMLLCFDKWYRYEEILSVFSIAAASRKDEDTLQKLTAYANELTRKTGAEICVVEIQPLELSSTELRERIKKMQDTSCYFPKKIVQYICEHNIYNIKGCRFPD